MSQLVAFEAIPTAQAIGRHSKVVSHGKNGVAAMNSVTRGLARVGDLACISGPSCRDRDDDLGIRLQIFASKIVYFPNRARTGVILPGDTGQGISACDVVVPPGNAFVQRDRRHGLFELVLAALRKTQVVGRIPGSSEPQKAGIQFRKRVQVAVDTFRHQPQIDWVVDPYRVRLDWKRRLYLIESVLSRVLGHDRER